MIYALTAIVAFNVGAVAGGLWIAAHAGNIAKRVVEKLEAQRAAAPQIHYTSQAGETAETAEKLAAYLKEIRQQGGVQ